MNPRNRRYRLKLLWDGRSGGEVNFEDHPTLKLDMPKEFGGEGRYHCPDDLFFSAIGGCLLTTFLYFQRKLDLRLKDVQILLDGSVNLVGPEGYRVTGLKATMRIETVRGEEEKAEECFKLMRDFCHIARTLGGTLSTEITKEILLT